MKQNYSFLKDELALNEIRKHKWLESEKEEKEISFANAAIDWIKKHGDDWLRARLDFSDSTHFFTEKRMYRRFRCHLPLLLEVDKTRIATFAKDINLIALSCITPMNITKEKYLKVIIDFPVKNKQQKKREFQFATRVLRSNLSTSQGSNKSYKVTFSLNEQIRDYLRGHTDLFRQPQDL